MDSNGPQITTRDWVLGALTFPLLVFVMMFAITGFEQAVARPEMRLRIYLALLGVELVLVVSLVAWLVSR